MTTEKPSSYATAWDNLRSRQQWFFGTWLGGFAASVLLAQIKFLPFWIAPKCWAVGFFYTANRWISFLCPRCGKPFFRPNSWTTNQFRSTCPHCGLKKYAKTDAGEETRYLRMYEP